MGFLEVASSYLGGRNMRGYGENGCPRPVTVVQAVDEMEVAWPATARTNGEPPCQLRLGACGEGGRFFMPAVDPFDRAIPTDFLSDRVERISNDAVDPPNSSLDQNLHQFRCYRVGHPCAPWSTIRPSRYAQLKPGGRLVMPLGPAEDQRLSAVSKSADNAVEVRPIVPARFSSRREMCS